MFETDADRLAHVTTFGENVTFTIGVENWDAFGIFDNEFIDVDGVESRQPVLTCRLDDIYKPGEQQNIEFRATAVLLTADGFSIKEVQEDGVGMVLLILELQ